jgi:hypothetical protein
MASVQASDWIEKHQSQESPFDLGPKIDEKSGLCLSFLGLCFSAIEVRTEFIKLPTQNLPRVFEEHAFSARSFLKSTPNLSP